MKSGAAWPCDLLIFRNIKVFLRFTLKPGWIIMGIFRLSTIRRDYGWWSGIVVIVGSVDLRHFSKLKYFLFLLFLLFFRRVFWSQRLIKMEYVNFLDFFRCRLSPVSLDYRNCGIWSQSHYLKIKFMLSPFRVPSLCLHRLFSYRWFGWSCDL